MKSNEEIQTRYSMKKSKYPAPRVRTLRIEVLYGGSPHETDEDPTACTFLASKINPRIHLIRLKLVSPSQKTEQNQNKTKEGGRDSKRCPAGRQLVHRALSVHISARSVAALPASSICAAPGTHPRIGETRLANRYCPPPSCHNSTTGNSLQQWSAKLGTLPRPRKLPTPCSNKGLSGRQ